MATENVGSSGGVDGLPAGASTGSSGAASAQPASGAFASVESGASA